MKSNLSPKKRAGRTHAQRAKVLISNNSSTQRLADSTQAGKKEAPAFNFEEITPLMQIKERNSAYQFFSL